MNFESGWFGWPPPPCPGGSPAGEGLAIVTFSPGVCEKEWRTHFCSVIGWSKERESASLSPLFLSSSVIERLAVNWLVVGSNPTWGENQKDFWNKTQTGRCKKRRISRRVNFFHTHGLILHVKMFYSVVDITLYLYIRREWYAKRLNEDFLPALKFNTFDSRNGYPFRVLNRLGSCLLSFYQQIARWDSYLYHSVLLSFY